MGCQEEGSGILKIAIAFYFRLLFDLLSMCRIGDFVSTAIV